jgi:hypothetical protein
MSADSIKRVCFVGIGNMGWPMAARLVRAGFEVAVTDAVAGRAKAFVDEVGGKVVSLAEATKQADVVVTMLPTSAHVVSVVDEILPSLSSGKILVDMSSGAPAATQKIAGDLGGIGVSVVDAPVSGGVSRAVTGELAIMTGGDATALDRVDPLLRAMGTTIHRIGPVGAGQAMKALNNLVSAGGFLMAVEALAAIRPRSLGDDGRPQRFHRHEQQYPEETQAIRVVTQVRQRLQPGFDGERSLDRAGGRSQRVCANAAFRALPRNVGECRKPAWQGPGPYCDCKIERGLGRRYARK